MKQLAIAAVLAVLGAALGWFLAGGGPPHHAAAPEGAEREPVHDHQSPDRHLAPEQKRTLREVLARDFPLLDPSGRGTIAGTVTDEKDAPQAGLTLIAEPVLPLPGASLAEQIRHWQRLDAYTRTTTTDADGRFVFRDLPEAVAFQIREEERSLIRKGKSSGPCRAGDIVDFTLYTRRGFRLLPVTVHVMLHGRAVPRAQLAIQSTSTRGERVHLGATRLRDWSTVQPELSLSIGQWQVRAFLDGEYASNVVTLDPERDRSVDLALAPCTSLFGRLEVPETRETVRLYVATQGDAATPDTDVKQTGQQVPVEAGGFRVLGIEPGSYRFGVTLDASPILRTWDVEIHEGMNAVTLTLGPITGADIPVSSDQELITITVIDPEGLPCEGITSFAYRTRMPQGTRSQGVQPVFADGNRYHLRLGEEQLGALEAGHRVEVSVSNDTRWGTCTIELAWGQADYTLQFPPQAEIEIELADYLGSGFEGAVDISVYHESDEGRHPMAFRLFGEDPKPDWLGECRFRQLRPGRNVVHVFYSAGVPEGQRHQSITWERRIVELAPGPNRITMPLPRLHRLTITFPEELQSAQLRLSQIDHGGISTSLEGVRTIDGPQEYHLPAGLYSARAGRSRMTFRLNSDMDIEFVPTRFRTMRVSHVPDESPLFELGLRARDLVIAIDGEPFADQRPADIVMGKLAENARVRLTVRRGMEQLDFTIDAALVPDRRSLILQPVLAPEEE